jgi:GAF domain-containing protein
MSDRQHAAVALARAQEQLRQEKEAFDQLKHQNKRWFVVRLVMAWIAVFLLPAIMIVCASVLLRGDHFTPTTVELSAAALFTDILGLVIAVWKIVLGAGPEQLRPITK